jgi:hypothetical protein
MHGRWDPVNDAIEAALSRITLADMDSAIPRAFRAPSAFAPLSDAPADRPAA